MGVESNEVKNTPREYTGETFLLPANGRLRSCREASWQGVNTGKSAGKRRVGRRPRVRSVREAGGCSRRGNLSLRLEGPTDGDHRADLERNAPRAEGSMEKRDSLAYSRNWNCFLQLECGAWSVRKKPGHGERGHQPDYGRTCFPC